MGCALYVWSHVDRQDQRSSGAKKRGGVVVMKGCRGGMWKVTCKYGEGTEHGTRLDVCTAARSSAVGARIGVLGDWHYYFQAETWISCLAIRGTGPHGWTRRLVVMGCFVTGRANLRADLAKAASSCVQCSECSGGGRGGWTLERVVCLYVNTVRVRLTESACLCRPHRIDCCILCQCHTHTTWHYVSRPAPSSIQHPV